MLMCRKDRLKSAAAINRWVVEKTNGKVTEIVPEDAIDSLTRLILVNAVYFKGDWLDKFNPKDTQYAVFHVSPSQRMSVKMMYRKKEKLLCGENRELYCQAVELPYVGNTLSMIILLPDQTATNLSEVEKKLTIEDLVNVKEKFKMSRMEVHLWLPRFRLDEKLSLSETLSAMGVHLHFVSVCFCGVCCFNNCSCSMAMCYLYF